MSNNTETILSPVTQKPGTRVFDTIRTGDIIKLYKDDYDIDVSDYFTGLDAVPIIECVTTGYRFYYPPTTEGSGTFYEHFQKKNIDNENWYRKWGYDYQFAYDNINKDEKVLDVGCGTGEFLKRIREKTANAYGLELNSVAWEKCKASGLTVYNETIQAHADKNPGAYDVVCIFQVLEHVYDIRGFLDAAIKALKKGGKLVIGVPNNEPYLQGYDKYSTLNLPPHHMGMWNQKALRNIQSHFDIQLQAVTYDAKPRWTVDAYFRAKTWWNIKTPLRKHSFIEKLKLWLAAPVSVPVSIFQRLGGRKSSAFVAALYKK